MFKHKYVTLKRLSSPNYHFSEIKCVSKNTEGKLQITMPGGSYQDASMSKCEACVCGLYGQIRQVILISLNL